MKIMWRDKKAQSGYCSVNGQKTMNLMFAAHMVAKGSEGDNLIICNF